MGKRIGGALLLPACVLLAPGFVGAQDTAECVRAHQAGQESRLDGALLRAREAFQQCAHANCPEVVRQDCLRWNAEVQVQLPSVRVIVELDGAPIENALVFLDGEAHGAALGAIEVDPGRHALRVELEGHEANESHFVARHGERNAPIDVVFRSGPVREGPTPPERVAPPFRVPRATWGLVGAAGASFVAAAVVGVRAAVQRQQGETCAPFCERDFVRQIDRQALASDVLVGVGLVSGAAALLVWWVARRRYERLTFGARGPELRLSW